MLKKVARLLLGICLLSLMILSGGCDFLKAPFLKTDPPNPPNVPANNNLQQPPKPVSHPVAALQLYYADKDAKYLVGEVRKADDKGNLPETALELLLAGTKKPGLVNVIPPGTKLKSLIIRDGTAYADFNENLLKVKGGSTTEIFLVGSIVNTLTEFKSINQVQILVEGKKIDTITGHLDLSKPVGRSEKIIKK